MPGVLILPSGRLLPLGRRVPCGPIGSVKLNELPEPAQNTAGHVSDRLSTLPDAEPAPTVATSPCPAVGAFNDTPAHGKDF